ncbi:MAG: hypothetical protein K9N10_06240 [Deltaproteobacteria bacterium]|nr:hypothetical protein [Deltaproteobacteria bacterium]
MQIDIQFNANLPVTITKREKWYLATCPILDIHSQGESKEKAKHNLGEALSLFFISCFERGVLDDVLKGCGFKAVQAVAQSRRPLVSQEDYISVPIPFLVDQNSNNECHA